MKQPVRVLQICEAFGPGGVAWWLIDMAKAMPRTEFQFDFLCLGAVPGMRMQEVQALGLHVTLFQAHFAEILLGKTLSRLIASEDYAIVHSHIFNLSGWMLRNVPAHAVPVRIAHFHNTRDGRPLNVLNSTRRIIGRSLIRSHANALLACSAAALDHAPRLKKELYRGVVHYGIDSSRFESQEVNYDLRSELGLSPSVKLVGHIGRFYPQKNHRGLIEIFAEVAKIDPNVHLVLVGDGPLQPTCRLQVNHLNLAHRVHFLGQRNDVPRILPNFDVFAFPSHHEGLGIVVLEALLAGVPVVASNLAAIAEAIDGSESAVLIDSSQQDKFTDAILAYLEASCRFTPSHEWKRRFARATSVAELQKVYESCLANINV